MFISMSPLILLQLVSSDVNVDSRRTITCYLDKSVRNTVFSITSTEQIRTTIINKATGEAVPTETDDSNRTLAYIKKPHYLWLVCNKALKNPNQSSGIVVSRGVFDSTCPPPFHLQRDNDSQNMMS